MKKAICLTLSVVMILLLLTGCGSKVSQVLDLDGEKVKVTVDLSGGWDAEFGDSVVYVYDQKNEEGVEAVGWAVYTSASDAEVRINEVTETYADDYVDVQVLEDGGLKWRDKEEEYGSDYYLVKVSDKTYMLIVCEDWSNGEAFFNRFDIKLA